LIKHAAESFRQEDTLVAKPTHTSITSNLSTNGSLSYPKPRLKKNERQTTLDKFSFTTEPASICTPKNPSGGAVLQCNHDSD